MMLAAALAALCATPARATVSVERVTEAVRVRVAEAAAVPVADVEVLHLGLARALDCPNADPIQVDLSSEERFTGHSRVTVRVGDPEHPCERVTLRSRIRVWTTVPVAAAPAAPGDLLPVATGRVALDTLKGVPLPLSASSQPWLAKIGFREGEPVLADAVRAPPAARSGADVVLLGVLGDLEIRAPGRLMEDAFVGESVSVLNLATHTVQKGTLMEDGRVHVRVSDTAPSPPGTGASSAAPHEGGT